MQRATDLDVSGPRAVIDRWVVGIADPVLTALGRRWLFGVNALVLLFVVGPVVAPYLLAAGLDGAASDLYAFFKPLCHQWAFRSFFVLGPQATYSREQLAGLGVDPFTFVGEAALGWKMAFCERNLAIFVGLLVFGLMYAARWRRAGLRPASYLVYAALVAPMALDGLTQLAGLRESTWELRLATGALFGVASGWLLYPRLTAAMQGWTAHGAGVLLHAGRGAAGHATGPVREVTRGG